MVLLGAQPILVACLRDDGSPRTARAGDRLTIFEVSGGAVLAGRDGMLEAVGKSRDGHRRQLVDRVQLVAGHLGAVYGDDVALGRCEVAAVEDEQELGASLAVCAVLPPISDQEPPDRKLDPELFSDLASGGVSWTLARLDIAAWDVEVVLVGRDDEEDVLVLVEEQDAGGNPWADEGRLGLAHPAEPRAM
jgi:hypothetical protein